MENRIFTKHTGVCEIILVGLREFPGMQAVELSGTRGALHIHHDMGIHVIGLPPGKKYTFLCTLKTAREEDAAKLFGWDGLMRVTQTTTFVSILHSFIEKEGLYLKNPYGEKEPKPDVYVDGEGIHCKNSTLIDNWRAAEKRTFHDIAILLTE